MIRFGWPMQGMSDQKHRTWQLKEKGTAISFQNCGLDTAPLFQWKWFHFLRKFLLLLQFSCFSKVNIYILDKV